MRRSTPLDLRCVLVVDDDRSIREALAEILADEGYCVRTAENGMLALESCRAHPAPDLILLDLHMPVMDGLAFMRVKASDVVLACIPVCVMTAGGAVSWPADAAAVLHKPVGISDVIGLVKRFC